MNAMLKMAIILLFASEAFALSRTKAEEELGKALLKDYNKKVLPSEKTILNITDFHIDRFHVNYKDHVVMLSCWIAMSWKDSKLTWTPNLHEGIAEVPMHYYDIWIPDMYSDDGARSYYKGLWSYENAVVSSEGKVKYVPQYELPFYCVMDMTYWPHDAHNCSFKFRSWIHGAHRLDINLQAKPTVNVARKVLASGEAIGINEWVIRDISLSKGTNTFKCCKDPFIEVTFNFLLNRNAPAYTWTAKMPAAGLTILGMLIFILPPAASQKMIYGGLVLLFDLAFLINTSHIVINSADHAPLIIQMLSQQLFLVILSVALSAIIYRISASPHTTGIPAVIRDPVLRISAILLLGNFVDMASGSYKQFSAPMQDDQVELADDSPAAARQRAKSEWVLLGALVDRLVLILYLAITIITLIRFSSIL